jgi:hypothetical protein
VALPFDVNPLQEVCWDRNRNTPEPCPSEPVAKPGAFIPRLVPGQISADELELPERPERVLEDIAEVNSIYGQKVDHTEL